MNWYKTASEKVLYICRGISGSGKSTQARNLPGVRPENIFSTDDLLPQDLAAYAKFFQDMIAKKDFSPLTEAHQENVRKATMAMRSGTSPIAIDNTNLEAWNAKPYVEAALKFGYQVKFIDVGTGGLSAEQLAKRNKHGVPVEAIQKMIEKYNAEGPLSVEKVMQAERPEDKGIEPKKAE